MADFKFAYERPTPTVVPGGIQDVPVPVRPNIPQFAFEKDLAPEETQIDTQVRANPDQAAEENKLARENNVPIEMVQEDKQGFEQTQRVMNVQDMLTGSPVTGTFMMAPNIGAMVHDDLEALTAMEKLARRWRMGELVVERGRAGSNWRSTQSEQSRQRVRHIEEQMDKLGQDRTSGFLGWLEDASETLGQWAGTFWDVDAGVRVAGGAALGVGAAAAGLVAAPALAVAGAGALIGYGVHLGWSAFETEGGNIYIDLRDQGIDDQTATIASIGVGVVNSGLEIAGASAQGVVLKAAFKDEFRKAITRAFKDKRVLGAIGAAGAAYGASILSETGTEVIQEVVNITAERMAGIVSGIDQDDVDWDEVQERLVDVAGQTFRAMAVLGAPGATIAGVQNFRNSRKAETSRTAWDAWHDAFIASKTFKRDPAVASEHALMVMRDQQIDEVLIPADQLSAWLTEQDDPTGLMEQLNITTEMLEDGTRTGNDIQISNEVLAGALLGHENFKLLTPHIRMADGEMTQAEAQEYMSSGFQEDVDNAFNQPIRVEDPDIEMASEELGLKAFFESADEAGMTPSEYRNYLISVRTALDRAAARKQEKLIKQEERKLTEQWQQAEQKETAIVAEELLQNTPAYKAVADIGRDRLDRKQLEQAATAAGVKLSDLPKQPRRRNIYTARGEQGIDPDTYAQLHDYDSAVEMIQDIITTPAFDEQVQLTVDRRLESRANFIQTQRQRLQEARDQLHSVDQAKVLEQELNQLRAATQQKRISPRVIRAAAKAELAKLPLRGLSVRKFQYAGRKAARNAKRAMRKGRKEEALMFKTQQVINFHMAREMDKMWVKLERQRKELRAFQAGRKTNIPVKYQDAIQDVLNNIAFNPKPKADKEVKALRSVKSDLVRPVRVPENLTEPETNWKDMTLADWQSTYDTVKRIAKEGREVEKLRIAQESGDLEATVNHISALVRQNLGKNKRRNSEERTRIRKATKNFKDWASLLFNVDTVLLEVDGFEQEGVAFTNIKGRYDRAMTDGYFEDQKGFLFRQKEFAQKLLKLYDVFEPGEIAALNTPNWLMGMTQEVSHHTRLAIMLNWGNETNRQALLESEQYSDAEIGVILESASERDWKFVQSVWDLMEEVWPEIVATEQRRENVTPQRVEAVPIETPFGTFKGGYYPIKYRNEVGPFISLEQEKSIFERMKYGEVMHSQTRDGHTKARTEGQRGNPLFLDLSVVNSHFQQVLYDLEMGDAVYDIFKILSNPETKKAFLESGAEHKYTALELWFRDIVTGEIGIHDNWSRAARYIRNGFTVSSLSWNLGVSALQILGIMQSSVLVGKKNMLMSMYRFARAPQVGEGNAYDFVRNQSKFMATRQDTFHKDIIDAATRTRRTLLDAAASKVNPVHGDNVASIMRESAFMLIKKMQSITDTITWMAAFDQGMEIHNGDHDKAVVHADRLVRRTQASGIFGDRTPLERGSLSPSLRQSEFVRMFTPFMSYFAAKTNIAIERTKQQKVPTKLKDVADLIEYASDMALIYFWESIFAGLLYGRWAYEDDESFAEFALWETLATITAGVPFLREIIGAAEGFDTGGATGAFIGDIIDVGQELTKEDFDVHKFLMDANRLTGYFTRHPASQINKTYRSGYANAEGEEVSFIDWALGPNHTK